MCAVVHDVDGDGAETMSHEAVVMMSDVATVGLERHVGNGFQKGKR